MNGFILEYVQCDNPECKELFVIRQDTFAVPDEGQQWRKKDTRPLVAACPKCKHVYNYDNRPLKSFPSPEGLFPADPHAALRECRVNVPCGEVGCDAPLSVIAVRNRDTSDEAMLREAKDEWIWEGLTCPERHAIPDRKKAQR